MSSATLWISRCIATARERIPGSIDNYVTGVSECIISHICTTN
ncbi:hypothetical protein [Photorhabdus laumondii]